MNATPCRERVSPDKLLPGDVFQYHRRHWLLWETPYVEYAEWDEDGGILSSMFWECQVQEVLIRKRGNLPSSPERVVTGHAAPYIGVRFGHKLIRRDDLRDRLYMPAHIREAIAELRAAAEEALIA